MKSGYAENDNVALHHLIMEPGEVWRAEEDCTQEKVGIKVPNAWLNYGCCAGELLVDHPTLPQKVHYAAHKDATDCMLDPAERATFQSNTDGPVEYYSFLPVDLSLLHANNHRHILAAGEMLDIRAPAYAGVVRGSVRNFRDPTSLYPQYTLFTITEAARLVAETDDTFIAVIYREA